MPFVILVLGVLFLILEYDLLSMVGTCLMWGIGLFIVAALVAALLSSKD